MEPRFFNHGDRRPRPGPSGLSTPVSMEPRFFNHGDVALMWVALSSWAVMGFNGATVFQPWRPPPRFLRVSSWASGGDFEHLLASLQKLCDFGAASRVAPRVAAVSRCEHLPGFRPVLRCSKMPLCAIRRLDPGPPRHLHPDNSPAGGFLLPCRGSA